MYRNNLSKREDQPCKNQIIFQLGAYLLLETRTRQPPIRPSSVGHIHCKMSSAAPLLPKNSSYNKRPVDVTRGNLKPSNRNNSNSPATTTANDVNKSQKFAVQQSNQYSAVTQAAHTVISKHEIIYNEHRRLLDMCIKHNCFKDAQVLCEKLIQKYRAFEVENMQ